MPQVARRVLIALLVALVVAGAVPRRLFAQAGGAIAGTVRDSSGGVVPGAAVTLVNNAIGTQFTAITDAQGAYSFPNVPVGRYDLLVALDGFKPLRRPGLAVDINSRTQSDATLEVGTQSETVTVTANAVHVETASTQIGEVVAATTMTTLSLNGRSFTDLLAIQPGVIPVTTLQA